MSKKNFQIPENRTLREECERVLVSEWLFDLDLDSSKNEVLDSFNYKIVQIQIDYVIIFFDSPKKAGYVVAVQPHFCLRKNLRYKIKSFLF